MNSNRKRQTNRTTAKKCLRHCEDCGILNIKKDICANRCPTGATDRRLARLFSHKIAVTFGWGWAAIFVSCYYLCYRWRIRDRNRSDISQALKSTLLSSTFASALLSQIPLRVSMYRRYIVIGGSQSLRRGLTAYHLSIPK